VKDVSSVEWLVHVLMKSAVIYNVLQTCKELKETVRSSLHLKSANDSACLENCQWQRIKLTALKPVLPVYQAGELVSQLSRFANSWVYGKSEKDD